MKYCRAIDPKLVRGNGVSTKRCVTEDIKPGNMFFLRKLSTKNNRKNKVKFVGNMGLKNWLEIWCDPKSSRLWKLNCFFQ